MDAFGYAVITACIWGVVPIFEKIGLTGPVQPSVGVVFRSFGVCVGMAVLLSRLPLSSVMAVPWRSSLWLMAGGCLASVGGQLLFYHSLKHGEASRMVIVAGMYPLVTCLLGLVVLREPLTTAKAAGVALIIAGVTLLR